MKYNKGFAGTAVLIIILLIIVGGFAYYSGQRSTTKNEVDITTTTNSPSQNATSQTAQQNTMNISTVLPQYIGAQSGWPPVVTTSTTAFSCTPIHTETTDTVQKTIGNRTYCVTDNHEGAAGSIYHTYTYKTANGNGTKTTQFTLRYVGCGAYGNPQMTQCQSAQTVFDANLDVLVDSLM